MKLQLQQETAAEDAPRSPSPKRRRDYSSKLPQLDIVQSFDSQQQEVATTDAVATAENVDTTQLETLPGTTTVGAGNASAAAAVTGPGRSFKVRCGS